MITPAKSGIFLPEIDDGMAGETVEATYREIKRLWGIDSPALFFRTLATLPDGLAACWQVIRPFAESGLLHTAALGLVHHTQSRLLGQGFTVGEPRPTVTQEQKGHIQNALASYNRANPQNLMAAAILSVHGSASDERPLALTSVAWQPPSVLTLSTAMLHPEEIPLASTNAIARLSDLGCSGGAARQDVALMPSLYRHLARYPTFMSYAAEVLHSASNREVADEAIENTRSQALLYATQLIQDPSTPKSQFPDEVERLIVRFVQKIPEMVVMGIFLRGLL